MIVVNLCCTIHEGVCECTNVYTDCNDFVWAHTFILKSRLMDQASMFPHWNRKFYFIFFYPSNHLLRVLWNIYFVHAIHRTGPHPYFSFSFHEHNISGREKWWFFKKVSELHFDWTIWALLYKICETNCIALLSVPCRLFSFASLLLSSSPSQYVIVHPSRDRITFLWFHSEEYTSTVL